MNKKTIILGSFCIVLLITWVIGLFTAPENQARRRRETPLITSLDRDAIQGVTIGDLVFSNTSGSWMLDSLPARDDRVSQLLDDVETAKNKGKVGADDDAYGLSEDRMIRIDDSSGNAQTVRIGNRIEGSRDVYATLNDIDMVVKTGDALDFYFRQSEAYWQDLRLYPERTRPEYEDIIQITFEGDELNFNIKRTVADGLAQWQIDENLADENLTDAYVRTFFNLEASKIFPLGSVTVGEKVLTIQALEQNGAVYTTAVYASEDLEVFYVHPSGIHSEYYFKLTAAIKDRIARDQGYFLLEPTDTDTSE